MVAVRVRAPAKINLQLTVGARRADGYHDLATVFQAVSLYDEVVATESTELRLTVDGDEDIAVTDVPVDETNLAARAATLLAAHLGVEPLVHLHLHKGIPVAGGMAGGSADAAAALVALGGGSSIGYGRGELLTPVLGRGRFEWVLALAADGLSTPAVYAECDRMRTDRVLPAPRVSDELMTALRAGDPGALGHALRNDLQPAACSLYPDLRRTLVAGDDQGALGGVVSGSGPTVALLARDAEHAIDLAVALSATGVAKTIKRAHGPVPGARVVEEH
jgi:4-diphosphocytidyl-2-C-methyl-D-erythritol kinase